MFLSLFYYVKLCILTGMMIFAKFKSFWNDSQLTYDQYKSLHNDPVALNSHLSFSSSVSGRCIRIFGQVFSLILDDLQLEGFFLIHFYVWTFAMMHNQRNKAVYNWEKLINILKAEIMLQLHPQILRFAVQQSATWDHPCPVSIYNNLLKKLG